MPSTQVESELQQVLVLNKSHWDSTEPLAPVRGELDPHIPSLVVNEGPAIVKKSVISPIPTYEGPAIINVTDQSVTH